MLTSRNSYIFLCAMQVCSRRGLKGLMILVPLIPVLNGTDWTSLSHKYYCKLTRLHDFHYFSFILNKSDLQRAQNAVWLWLFIQMYFSSFSIPMILHHLHKFVSYLKFKTGVKCKMEVKWKMCLGSRVNTQAVSPHWAPAASACHTRSC